VGAKSGTMRRRTTEPRFASCSKERRGGSVIEETISITGDSSGRSEDVAEVYVIRIVIYSHIHRYIHTILQYEMHRASSSIPRKHNNTEDDTQHYTKHLSWVYHGSMDDVCADYCPNTKNQDNRPQQTNLPLPTHRSSRKKEEEKRRKKKKKETR
jgi:hypothetical protein